MTIFRDPDDRVLPGKQMRDCLEANKHVLKTIARKAGILTCYVVAAYKGERISREQWHRIAEVFRLVG